jgi:hypothetical protein
VITADSDLRLRRYDISGPRTIKAIEVPSFIVSIATSVDRSVTFAGDLEGVVRRIDWRSESVDDLCCLDAKFEEIVIIDGGDNEQLLVTSRKSVWIVKEDSVWEFAPRNAQTDIVCTASRPDSHIAIAGTDEGSVIWIDTSRSNVIFETPILPGKPISDVTLNLDASRVTIWSPEGEAIITSDRDGSNQIVTPTGDAVEVVMSRDSGAACVLYGDGPPKRILVPDEN